MSPIGMVSEPSTDDVLNATLAQREDVTGARTLASRNALRLRYDSDRDRYSAVDLDRKNGVFVD